MTDFGFKDRLVCDTDCLDSRFTQYAVVYRKIPNLETSLSFSLDSAIIELSK